MIWFKFEEIVSGFPLESYCLKLLIMF